MPTPAQGEMRQSAISAKGATIAKPRISFRAMV
jgi:hypothetical protein